VRCRQTPQRTASFTQLRGLDETNRARTVRAAAGAHEITVGPYVESKEWLVGFYVVECESDAQAIERAKQICPDSAHVVEVRPVTWRWKP